MSAIVLLIAAVAVTTVNGIPNPIDAACVALHCTVQSAACFADKMCSSNVGCASKCFGDWDKDKSEEKFLVQNCTNKCTFSYDSPAYEKFMNCLGTHKCMHLPPIPNTCKGPNNITILKQVDISELNGAWWVMRGHHLVYDCYPCQRNVFKPFNSTAMIYNPMYQVYLVNESLAFINQSGFLMTKSTPQAGYPIIFDDAGFDNFETWWIIDKAADNSYYLIYYCGSVLQWYFEGAIIYSATPSLSDSAIPAITDSYKKATGLDFNTFCSPAVGSQCPDA